MVLLQLRKEEEDKLLEARWVVKSNDNENVIMLLSEDRFDLSPPIGRRSFKGFNPALETLATEKLKQHQQTENRKEKRRAKLDQEKKEEQQGQSVTDEQMAAFALQTKRKR
jgi:hypothetical protein